MLERPQLFREPPARTSCHQLRQRIARRPASADQLNCLRRDALLELIAAEAGWRFPDQLLAIHDGLVSHGLAARAGHAAGAEELADQLGELPGWISALCRSAS